ncbi:hypothetical protein DYB34_000846 [Aphanomyces astaci]|uniref:Peptide-methionine (R)-S-oxide reductase n=2 Tax=Aphanomyces astaci TaxID=112090 RepID=A0A418BRI3_APHAT|nr:hypothetical protein DYB34_000846 [Aphanomyces astaci]
MMNRVGKLSVLLSCLPPMASMNVRPASRGWSSAHEACRMMSSKDTLVMSEADWQRKLTPARFRILRLKDTEYPGTGAFNKHTDKGVYTCGGCGTPLYTSEHKFDAGCGWPAFFDAVPNAVKEIPDEDGHRTEIVCAVCGGHLGHVFRNEGFPNPTNARHCVNSLSLDFESDEP